MDKSNVELTGLINRRLTLILFDDETREGYFSDNLGNQYKIPYHYYAGPSLNTSHVWLLANNRTECLLGDIEEGGYFTINGYLFRKKTSVQDPNDWNDIVTDRGGYDVIMHVEIPVLRFY